LALSQDKKHIEHRIVLGFNIFGYLQQSRLIAKSRITFYRIDRDGNHDVEEIIMAYKGPIDKKISITLTLTKCPFCNSKNIQWQTRLKNYRCSHCNKTFNHTVLDTDIFDKVEFFGLRNGNTFRRDRNNHMKGTHGGL